MTSESKGAEIKTPERFRSGAETGRSCERVFAWPALSIRYSKRTQQNRTNEHEYSEHRQHIQLQGKVH
jgi:hypothetical protein